MKTIIKSLKLKIDIFLNSKLYPVSLAIITFIFWVCANKTSYTLDIVTIIGFTVFTTIITFLLVFYKDTYYAFIAIFFLLFMMGVNQFAYNVNTLNESLILILPAVILISGIITYFIKNKVNINNGKLKIGLLFLAIAYILSYTISENTKNNILPYTIQCLLGLYFFLVYLLVVNTIRKDHLKEFLFVLLVAGILISLEFLSEYIRYITNASGSLFDRIDQGISAKWGDITLGWGVHNDGALYLSFFIPVVFYYIIKKPKNILLYFIIIFEASVLLISVSRGGYISFGLALIFMTIIVIKKGEKRTKITFLIFLGGLAVILAINYQMLISIYDRLKGFGTDFRDIFNGRFELWEKAFNIFVKNPIVGGSFYNEIDEFSRPIIYHSTIMHTLATMGLFGLGALIFHFVQVIKLLKEKWSFEVLCLSVGMLVTNIHGLIDNTYFMFNFMLVSILIYGIIELSKNSSNEEI